jgi:hypothetical protein
MGRYLGTAELYAYLFGTTGTIATGGGTITATQQSLLGSAILEAEAAIDAHTRRTFVATPGTHYLNRYEQDMVRSQALYINTDIFSLVAVQNGDGQNIPLGSLWLEPRNEGPPFRAVRLMSSYVWVWNTDGDVILSGSFGYGTVPPADIVSATKQLAAYLYRLKDVGPGGVTGFTEGGEPVYPPGMPDTVRIILEKYRSRSGGVV